MQIAPELINWSSKWCLAALGDRISIISIPFFSLNVSWFSFQFPALFAFCLYSDASEILMGMGIGIGIGSFSATTFPRLGLGQDRVGFITADHSLLTERAYYTVSCVKCNLQMSNSMQTQTHLLTCNRHGKDPVKIFFIKKITQSGIPDTRWIGVFLSGWLDGWMDGSHSQFHMLCFKTS